MSSSPDPVPGILAPNLSYEQARDLASTSTVETRIALAGRVDVAPEILYFLTQDDDPRVRVTVAANPSAPVKANVHLARDADEAVREALATKVATAEQSGGQGRSERQKALSRSVLDHLAQDQLTAVRAAIAEGLKSVSDADPDLINRLARDLEILVAAPVLEHSPVLRDEDLLDIISSSPVQGAMAAIARRAYVDARVTDAIVASGDTHAITHLLYNANAHLQEHTLDALVDSAGSQPDWQPPLIHRPELRDASIRRLAEVVADNLLDRLMQRDSMSPETAAEVREVVGQRLRERFGDTTHPVRPPHAPGDDLPSPFDRQTEERLTPHLQRAQALQAQNKLNETVLSVALLTDDVDSLVAGLSVRTTLNVRVVLDILSSQSARAICALAWAADLPARFALELQVKLGRIPLDYAIRPGAGGTYQPSEAEMRWQIEMFVET